MSTVEEMERRRREESLAYLSSHPEIAAVLERSMTLLLSNKPVDPLSFLEKALNESIQIERNKKQPSPSTTTLSIPESELAPLVVVGPSGVGKGTLITRLMKEYGSRLGFSVSHTTRNPRPGEAHGTHYHFHSRGSMQRMIEDGNFVETAEVHGNYYGTSFSAIRTLKSQGKVAVLDIDVQGMMAVKRADLSPRTVYIAPPSLKVLEERLAGRGTETPEAMMKRLANAVGEIDFLEKPGTVDRKIVNDDVEVAYMELKQQLRIWYPHLHPE